MEITYDDFKKVQIKVGTILEVKKTLEKKKEQNLLSTEEILKFRDMKRDTI